MRLKKVNKEQIKSDIFIASEDINFINEVDKTIESSKKSKMEEGFAWCVKNDKTIIDKKCKGTECEISPKIEKCKDAPNMFHTHVLKDIALEPGTLSAPDIIYSLDETVKNNKPITICMSHIDDENKRIKCFTPFNVNKKDVDTAVDELMDNLGFGAMKPIPLFNCSLVKDIDYVSDVYGIETWEGKLINKKTNEDYIRK